MQIPKSTKSAMYPAFIRENKVVQTFSNQQKVFPKIGLRNGVGTFSLGKTKEIDLWCAAYLDEIRQLLNNESVNQGTLNYYDNNLAANRTQFRTVIATITGAMKKNPASFSKIFKDDINFVIPMKLEAFGVQFPAGTDLIGVLQSIRTNCGLYYLTRIDNLLTGATSFEMLKNKNLKIVFSGTGGKGLWDIATMSMRGINSCQRWENLHATALIGSLVDPYAGIIYLTDQTHTSYGTNMVRRSVVRFVVNKKNRRPAIMLERIYPHDYNSGVSDYITLGAFTDFIQKKTKNKFPVIYGEFTESSKYFIPITKPVSQLETASRSYRDSKIPYQSSPKYKNVSKIF